MAETFGGGSPAASTDDQIRERLAKTKENTPDLSKEEMEKARAEFDYNEHIRTLDHPNLIGPHYPKSYHSAYLQQPGYVDTSKAPEDKSLQPSGQTIEGKPTLADESGARHEVEVDPNTQLVSDKTTDEKLKPSHNVDPSAIVMEPEVGEQPADAVSPKEDGVPFSGAVDAHRMSSEEHPELSDLDADQTAKTIEYNHAD